MADYWDNAVVEPEGLDRQAQVESGGDPTAVSPKGARGLFQIMPATAKDYGVDQSKLDDPGISRYVAARRMSELTDRYKGDRRLALAAYNWGPAHIDRVGGDESKWPKETRDYVKKNMGGEAVSAAAPSGDYWAQAKVADPLAPERGLSPAASAKRMEEVEGPVTSSYDPLVENVTIGAVTGGLGVPAGFGFIPKTVGGKLLTMAEGSAEQYLYGWVSEKAQQAGTELVGPKTGTVAGIVAPLALGGIQGRVGSGLGRLRAPVSAAQEEAARIAATTSEAKAYEAAPETIYDFGEDVAKANEKAAGKTKDAFEKAATLRQKETTALTAEQKAAQAKTATQAGQAMMQDFFGRSPEEAAAVRRMPLEDLALHRANMRKAVFGPINRISNDLGKQFEVATEGRLGDLAENTESLTKTVGDERQWLGERGMPLSKPVEDLLAKLPSAETGASIPESQVTDLMSGEGPAAAKARLTQMMDQYVAAHKDNRIPSPTMRSMASQALGGPRTIAPTVGELLGWRSEAAKLVGSQVDHNQHVAMEVRDALDQTLMDSGINIPPELREQWGTYKSLFDKGFRRNVATAPNPIGYGKKLFETPERGLQIIRNATPDERQSLKQLGADYVYARAYSPKTMGKKIDAQVLRELYGGTPYEKLAPWMDTEKDAVNWESAVASNPQVEQLIQKGYQSDLANIATERAADVRKAGIKLAQKLGPAGRGKLAKILSTRDPVAAAKIVEREFPISPEAAQKLYADAQQMPAKRAFDQTREAKQIEKGLDINAERENAAVAELLKQPQNRSMDNLKRRLYAWHLPMLLAGGAASLAGGHAGMGLEYQLGISGMIASMMAAREFREMLRPALTDPEAAREYWRAISMTPSMLNARKFGAQMARIAIATGSRKMAEQPQAEEEEAAP